MKIKRYDQFVNENYTNEAYDKVGKIIGAINSDGSNIIQVIRKPGVGLLHLLEQTLEEKSIDYKVLSTQAMDVSDVIGLVDNDDDSYDRIPENSVVIFDEFDRAKSNVQKNILNLIIDKKAQKFILICNKDLENIELVYQSRILKIN